MERLRDAFVALLDRVLAEPDVPVGLEEAPHGFEQQR
jgi:hypothetical protein